MQYRDKISETGELVHNALILRRLTRNSGIPLIINDRLDVALAVEADGIHVGPKDMPVAVIRKLAPDLLIGVSISSVQEFEISPNADYYGIGAVFPTDTKEVDRVPGLNFIRQIRKRTNLPLVGIGGINETNAEQVIRAGCDGAAVISALLGTNDVRSATQRLRNAIDMAKSANENELSSRF